MFGNRSLQISTLRKLLPIIKRFVSTSNRSSGNVAVGVEGSAAKTKDKNWQSYGYDYVDKEADRNAMHSIMFVSITLCLVVGGFFFAYMPDNILRDWSQREAFLELKRREKNGLPLIDPNYANAAKIVLPSDEELGNTEIIV